MTLLFTYGTLMSGQSRHDVLDGCKLVDASATSLEHYYLDSSRSFPMIFRRCNDAGEVVFRRPWDHGFISGELYSIPDSLLDVLDWIEGNGHFYQRRETRFALSTEGTVTAWIYETLPEFGIDLQPQHAVPLDRRSLRLRWGSHPDGA